MSRLRPAILLALLSCAAPPPLPPHLELPPPPPATASAAPPGDPEAVSVAAVSAPAERFVLDGDLGEWGSLAPPVASPPASGQLPNAPDAISRVRRYESKQTATKRPGFRGTKKRRGR